LEVESSGEKTGGKMIRKKKDEEVKKRIR